MRRLQLGALAFGGGNLGFHFGRLMKSFCHSIKYELGDCGSAGFVRGGIHRFHSSAFHDSANSRMKCNCPLPVAHIPRKSIQVLPPLIFKLSGNRLLFSLLVFPEPQFPLDPPLSNRRIPPPVRVLLALTDPPTSNVQHHRFIN
jgi:hypothetical protein